MSARNVQPKNELSAEAHDQGSSTSDTSSDVSWDLDTALHTAADLSSMKKVMMDEIKEQVADSIKEEIKGSAITKELKEEMLSEVKAEVAIIVKQEVRHQLKSLFKASPPGLNNPREQVASRGSGDASSSNHHDHGGVQSNGPNKGWSKWDNNDKLKAMTHRWDTHTSKALAKLLRYVFEGKWTPFTVLMDTLGPRFVIDEVKSVIENSKHSDGKHRYESRNVADGSLEVRAFKYDEHGGFTRRQHRTRF